MVDFQFNTKITSTKKRSSNKNGTKIQKVKVLRRATLKNKKAKYEKKKNLIPA